MSLLNKSNNSVLSFNLDDYLWTKVLSEEMLINNITKNKKNINYKNLQNKKYNLDDIVDNNKLNKKIITDHNGRGWKFLFKKSTFPYISKELDRTKYGSNENEKYIIDLDNELKSLTNDASIIKRIKMTSYQVIQGYFSSEIFNYFNCQKLTNGNIIVKPYFKPDKSDKYIIVDIGKYNNEIISNIKSYYIIKLININNDDIYDICRIDFNIIINFTKNTIDFKYKINYMNNLYKNIIIELPKLFFETFNGNTKNNLLSLIFEILFNDNIVKNINKQRIFYNYIYKLLKNIKDEKSYNIFEETIEFLYQNCNLIENNIIKNKNILNKSLNATIPITKNNKDKVHSDFLIVSYNEAAEQFTYNDCLPILFKILNENPSFIIVCTQESKTGNFRNIYDAGHYEHVLNNYITKLDYERIKKVDASVIGIKDKNVRTRIYINKNNVLFDKSLLKNNMANTENTENNNYNPREAIINYNPNENILSKHDYLITDIDTKKSVESGLGTISNKTLYKGSIFTKLEIKNMNGIEKDYKIIVVNSHLYYKKSGNTGLEKREKELSDIIKEFDLINYWNQGYNIFFCGDMNFRLNNVHENYKINSEYKSIISNYLLNESKYKEKSSTKFKTKDELYKFIINHSLYDKMINNTNKKLFIEQNKKYHNYNIHSLFENIKNNDSDENKKLKKELYKDFMKYMSSLTLDSNTEKKERLFYTYLIDSINTLGIHLSSKYFEGQSLKNIEFYKNKKIENYKQIFDIYPKKDGAEKYARVPSGTDRIIYALSEKNSNIKISPYNFNVHLFPDKSDHKMISLSFELCDGGSGRYEYERPITNKEIEFIPESATYNKNITTRNTLNRSVTASPSVKYGLSNN